MTLEQAIEMIETLKTEKQNLTEQLQTLSTEKESYNNLVESLKSEKEELSKQVNTLKESNMRYFERLTFQNENIQKEEVSNKQEEEKSISLDDVVNSFL